MRASLAAAILLTAVLAGCGGSGPSNAKRRTAVVAYIKRVDAIERALYKPLLRISSTYRSFSTKPAKLQREAPQFARAEQTLETLGTRLRRRPAPADARTLRRLVLELVAKETRLSRELTGLARFLPAFQADLAPLGPAGKQLKASLATITLPKPKRVPRSQLAAAKRRYAAAVAVAARRRAQAIQTYLATVGRTQRRLGSLAPPAVMAPSARAQLLTMRRVRTAGGKLVSALLARRYKAVPGLDRSFQEAALTSASLAVQRASIAAVKAYDADVHATTRLARRIDAEARRLQKALG